MVASASLNNHAGKGIPACRDLLCDPGWLFLCKLKEGGHNFLARGQICPVSLEVRHILKVRENGRDVRGCAVLGIAASHS